MPVFGNKSIKKLITCHPDIVKIMEAAINYTDFSVVDGMRTKEEQHTLWKKGRHLKAPDLDPIVRDNWIIYAKENVVTTKDGYEKLSKHQGEPSIAIDIVPYPSMWSSEVELHKLAGVIYTVQQDLFKQGKIKRLLMRGYELWNGFDMPHWQFKRS